MEERLGNVNRGATQGTIERCTYPHKYKKVRISQIVAHLYYFFESVIMFMARLNLQKGQLQGVHVFCILQFQGL